MTRTCSGHEDSYGFLKIKNRTKTDQDTDISKNQKKNGKNGKNASKMYQKCIKNESLADYDMT